MSRRNLSRNFKQLNASRSLGLRRPWPIQDQASRPSLLQLHALTGAERSALHLHHNQKRISRSSPAVQRCYRTEAHSADGPRNEGHETAERSGQRDSSQKLLLISSLLALSSVIVATFAIDTAGGLLDDTSLAAFVIRIRRGKPMNEKTFVPFIVTSKNQISSTSFIITIRPQNSPVASTESVERPQIHDLHSNKAVLRKCWEHGLWSVEVKQPQLQIARNYTPLPPRYGDETEELHSGALRFLIRKYDGGEVSTYLSRLSVGDKVELRGPHLGFDLKKRLGDASRLVILAGGTGIAPALQAIHLLHGHRDGESSVAASRTRGPLISILWANRRREDCAGSGDRTLTSNIIFQQLLEMRRQTQDAVGLKCYVDEEKAFIGANDVSKSIEVDRLLPFDTAGNCRYHSDRSIESCADGDPAAQEDCPCLLQSQATGVGKNIVMISGPDGFIQYHAGPKVWAGGEELQGPVSGVIGQLKRRYPATWKDWIVLKL